MAGRVSSPVLIGRRAELDTVRAALTGPAAGDRTVVLVSGEAGIGKSRLLSEVAASLVDDRSDGRSVFVLHGTCIDTAGGDLPYAPILEILGELTADPGLAHQAADLMDGLSGGSAFDTPSVGASEVRRARTFVGVRDLLVRAAGGAGLVVVMVDDLHWADRSTLDLLAYLARRLRGAAVRLVLAYRSDELHRRHPLRSVLGELERTSVIDRVDLVPLTPDEVAGQIAQIVIDEPGPELVHRVVELADGNPFHVEELLALGGGASAGGSLRTVLDARLDALDDASLAVVTAAAVLGRDPDVELLAELFPDAPDQVIEGVRQAVERHLLEPDADGRHYRFRHALLRQAAYEDLLPVERAAVHRRIAEILTDRPHLGAVSVASAFAERARHWAAAGDDAAALAAYVQAARAAHAASAWAEAGHALDRALELWDRLASPADVAGASRVDLLESAWLASNLVADYDRALAVIRQAQLEPEARADPRRAGRLAYEEAWTLNDLGRSAEAHAMGVRARDLIPPRPPTNEWLDSTTTLAHLVQAFGRHRESIALIDEVLRSPISTDGDPGAHAVRAVAWGQLGHDERAMADIVTAQELLAAATAPNHPDIDFHVVATRHAWPLIQSGRLVEAVEAIGMWSAAARRLGREDLTPVFEADRALALWWLGRWDEARAALDRSLSVPGGAFEGAQRAMVRSYLAAASGDQSGALAVVADAAAHADQALGGYDALLLMSRAWGELLARDATAALVSITRARERLQAHEDVVYWAPLCWLAGWALADAAEQAVASRDVLGRDRLAGDASGWGEVVTAIRGGTLVPGAGVNGAMALYLDLAEAELTRLHGELSPVRWQAVAEAAAGLDHRVLESLARYRLGEARLLAGDPREEAAAALGDALVLASGMGFVVLEEWIADLGRRARLSLTSGTDAGHATPGAPAVSADAAPANPWGLSPREREVLALVSRGWTNRQIGDALFISEKTASVHVTHILDKLGVSSRTEAALLAGRSGVMLD